MPTAYADSLEVALTKAAPNADAKVIALAVRATQCIHAQGAAPAQRLVLPGVSCCHRQQLTDSRYP